MGLIAIACVMRNGSFPSKVNLIETLCRFVTYFHEMIGKPMNWPYTGRPTNNQPNSRPRTWRELR